jgi:CRISPR/Cas system-associated exonuclease Cas4 (RecB family)
MKVGQLTEITFRKLESISPSRFNTLKNCTYRGLLARALGSKPLLPVPANASFGTVLHTMLELISKGIVSTEAAFEEAFAHEVAEMEKKIAHTGFDGTLPLQLHVKDYAVKKILVKKRLREEPRPASMPSSRNYIVEQAYRSNDGCVVGKIDLIVESDQDVQIIDFKTGVVYKDVSTDGEPVVALKDEYQDQLKLYAYIYFETTGKFPTQLSVIDLQNKLYSISATPAECQNIFQQAKNLLTAVNRQVDTGVYAVTPDIAHCTTCQYRPACSFFRKEITRINPHRDLGGIVEKVVKRSDGKITISLQGQDYQASITGFPADAYEYFVQRTGKSMAVFNIRKAGGETAYNVTKHTAIYE